MSNGSSSDLTPVTINAQDYVYMKNTNSSDTPLYTIAVTDELSCAIELARANKNAPTALAATFTQTNLQCSIKTLTGNPKYVRDPSTMLIMQGGTSVDASVYSWLESKQTTLSGQDIYCAPELACNFYARALCANTPSCSAIRTFTDQSKFTDMGCLVSNVTATYNGSNGSVFTGSRSRTRTFTSNQPSAYFGTSIGLSEGTFLLDAFFVPQDFFVTISGMFVATFPSSVKTGNVLLLDENFATVLSSSAVNNQSSITFDITMALLTPLKRYYIVLFVTEWASNSSSNIGNWNITTTLNYFCLPTLISVIPPPSLKVTQATPLNITIAQDNTDGVPQGLTFIGETSIIGNIKVQFNATIQINTVTGTDVSRWTWTIYDKDSDKSIVGGFTSNKYNQSVNMSTLGRNLQFYITSNQSVTTPCYFALLIPIIIEGDSIVI